MRVILIVGVIGTLCSTSVALHAGSEAMGASLDCATCHVSAQPSEGNAELRVCLRPDTTTVDAGASDIAPDVFLLDQLSEIYVPVVFPHKLHASMGEMGQGCTICHHRNPEGPILKCSECHDGSTNPVNLNQPGLKGAYHRQCLGCHREWTHETDCAICHAKREPGNEPVLPTDPTDIMGMLHPNIEVPDVKVFEVKDEAMSDARFVTFHHKQHVDLFGYKCVDCHQKESCSTCHDTGNRQPHVKEDPHQDCTKCHQEQIDNDCTRCHDAQVRPDGFNHGTMTKFDTGLYHVRIACDDCHRTRAATGFKGLVADCKACHAPNFQPKGFDHAVTGMPLGFLHVDASCGDCHIEGMGGKISCAGCHDDNRTKDGVEEIP